MEERAPGVLEELGELLEPGELQVLLELEELLKLFPLSKHFCFLSPAKMFPILGQMKKLETVEMRLEPRSEKLEEYLNNNCDDGDDNDNTIASSTKDFFKIICESGNVKQITKQQAIELLRNVSDSINTISFFDVVDAVEENIFLEKKVMMKAGGGGASPFSTQQQMSSSPFTTKTSSSNHDDGEGAESVSYLCPRRSNKYWKEMAETSF